MAGHLWAALAACWADGQGGEAIKPGPYCLPLIPGCDSALAIYTKLASGNPRLDQDPAVDPDGQA